MVALLLLCLLLPQMISGYRREFVEIRLSVKPEEELRVGIVPLRKTSIETKDGQQAIAIGHQYLSSHDGELGFGPDEFCWDICEGMLGKVISSGDKCLTYYRNNLEMDECFGEADFRSSLQMFDIRTVAEVHEDPVEIYDDLNLVSRLDASIENTLRNRTGFLKEKIP